MDIKNFYKDLEGKRKRIAIVGLGYVGIPLLIDLGKYYKVIGFDVSKAKIEKINNNLIEDLPGLDNIGSLDCILTSDEKLLGTANFFIIVVPTPIDKHHDPDLSMVINASKIVAKHMPKNSVIVYESTVYPGVTEDVCIPILEKESGLTNKSDFWVGYSPERVNPGDKVHTLENIVKIVSGQDGNCLEIIDQVYSKIIKAGTYRAESIKIAESAKVIENIQRDINIALINELAILFTKLGIDTSKVLKAANTKWNFLDFKPGLVGGHCIGIDPYYLTFKAKEIGYHTEMILAGRKINDNMSYFIGNEVLKMVMRSCGKNGILKIVLFGITFKEDIKDIRNSKVIDLYRFFRQYGVDVKIYDPVADADEVKNEYDVALIGFDDLKDMDAAVFCVAHKNFKQIDLADFKRRFRNKTPYIFDVKGIFEQQELEKIGYGYWRL